MLVIQETGSTLESKVNGQESSEVEHIKLSLSISYNTQTASMATSSLATSTCTRSDTHILTHETPWVTPLAERQLLSLIKERAERVQPSSFTSVHNLPMYFSIALSLLNLARQQVEKSMHHIWADYLCEWNAERFQFHLFEASSCEAEYLYGRAWRMVMRQ